MTALIKIIQLILVMSILILVHEFGHYIFAKLFKIRVEKFYIFFDAGGFRLFSTKNSRLLTRIFPGLKTAETDYGIGWLPLGGYCKISGMVDESMDREQLMQEPKEYEFRSHPAWQRLLVMFGGVFFNFLLAIGVYIGLLRHNGQAYIANEGNSIYAGELAQEMGFRTGDRILSFDDYVPTNFGMLQVDLARRAPAVVTVLRENDTVRLYMDHSHLGDILNCPDMFGLAIPFVVDTLLPSSHNLQSGLRRGDRIIAMDGHPINYVHESREFLKNYRSASITADVVRAGDSLEMKLQVDSAGLLGIYPLVPGIKTREYSLTEAIPAGFKMTFDNIGGYVRDIKLIFNPSTGAYKSVGSFIAIGQAMPSVWDWNAFFNIMAMLSIMLGVMNLIPIPALDGGHIAITLYEMITRRKPSEKFLMAVQMVGMILLMMLMFLAFGNDIGRLLR